MEDGGWSMENREWRMGNKVLTDTILAPLLGEEEGDRRRSRWWSSLMYLR
ncbi:hypothetical protein M2101_001071 [Parabacteroides sp. PM5-20]|nr:MULTISPECIES: hypothetical protein [unclassified Parabacteroides]MDH6534403.1 hypothetical protein [Parabacteroides sp. PM5-20]